MAFSRPLFCVCLFAALSALPTPLFAQYDSTNSVTVPVSETGVTSSAAVSVPQIKFVIFETESSGNLSQLVAFGANGPNGIKGFAEVRQIGKNGALSAPFALQFLGEKGKSSAVLNAAAAAASAARAASAQAASDPSDEQIRRIKEATGIQSDYLIRLLLSYYTEEEIIAKYGRPPSTPGAPQPPGAEPNPAGPPSSGAATLKGTAMLMKDACAPKINSYLVRFIVDLSAVDPASYATGFTVTGGIALGKGTKAALSIKPVSDGKFAPRPLLLVESMGYGYYNGGGEKLEIVKWKGAKPAKAQTAKINDYVYYRGYRLARVVANFLTGGSATAQISNGSQVGSACVQLVKKRQRINGYPG